MKKILAAFLFLLTACAETQIPQGQKLDFTDLKPIALNLDQMEIIYEDQSQAPYFFSPTPSEAVDIWAHDHFKLQGAKGSGKLTIYVQKANIIEVELPKKTNFTSMFKDQQTQKYNATIQLKIVAEAPSQKFDGYVEGEATKATTVSEGQTLNEKQKIWFNVNDGLMRDLTSRLDPAIYANFAPIVLY